MDIQCSGSDPGVSIPVSEKLSSKYIHRISYPVSSIRGYSWTNLLLQGRAKAWTDWPGRILYISILTCHPKNTSSTLEFNAIDCKSGLQLCKYSSNIAYFPRKEGCLESDHSRHECGRQRYPHLHNRDIDQGSPLFVWISPWIHHKRNSACADVHLQEKMNSERKGFYELRMVQRNKRRIISNI